MMRVKKVELEDVGMISCRAARTGFSYRKMEGMSHVASMAALVAGRDAVRRDRAEACMI